VLRVAGVLYARYALTLLSIAAAVVLIAGGVTRLLQVIANHTGGHFTIDLASPGIDSLSTFIVFAPAYPIFLFLIGAPVVAVLRRIDATESVTPWAALREVVPRMPSLLCPSSWRPSWSARSMQP
jgi:hypothetical protein